MLFRSGGLTEQARGRGLSTIGFAQFTPDGSKVAMTDTPDPTAPWARTAVGHVAALVGQSLDTSSDSVAKINQQLALEQSAPSQPLAQSLPNPGAPVRTNLSLS